MPRDAPQRRIPAAAYRAALDLLADSAEPARFLFGPAKLEWPDTIRPESIGEGSLWLLGVDRRVLLFSAGDQPRVIWRGSPGDVHAEPLRQLLATNCRLTGGQWQLTGDSRPLAIRLPAGLVASYGTYFRPLLVLLGQAAGTAEEPAVT
jgi:hypothetical protein